MYLQAQHFYDISTLGLHWLNEARDTDFPRARSLSTIFYALRELGLITEKQRRMAKGDLYLRRLLSRQVVTCQESAWRSREEERDRQIESSRLHLVVMLMSSEVYDRTRLIAGYGHKFYLSNAGLAYAKIKEGPYRSIVTREMFLAGWETSREKVERLMQARRGKPGRQVVEELEESEEFEDLGDDEEL